VAERKQLEFFLLRYVPDAVKGEFINFGVVAVKDGPNGVELIDVRFTKDRSRILCLDPQADLDVLTKVQEEVQREIGMTRDRAVLWRKMEDSFSNVIQVSQVMPVLSREPAVFEIETVARFFLETTKLSRTREPIGRSRIWATMRDKFDKAGVLPLLMEVPAEPYTKPGDPFAFDFGYNTGSEIKLFHAVSLKAGVESAVLLAARYPKIAPVMARVTQATPQLTAVIDDDLDRGQEVIQFALGMMEEERIRVAVAAEMPMIAEVARRELKV
jgi:hypothetical protein